MCGNVAAIIIWTNKGAGKGNMNVDLLYGRNSIPLRLPEDIRVTVVRKHPMILIRNPARAVKQALEKPVGSLPLAEMARHGKTACILICDITRPVPNGALLPPLIATIPRAGIPKEEI